MKRIYAGLCAAFVLILLAIGLISTFDKDATFSESERRQLKTRPSLTVSGLLDGSYFEDYRAYFADTFPSREKLMSSNTELNAFYYFGGKSSGIVIDFNTNAAQHGEALKNTEGEESQSSQPEDGTTGEGQDPTEDSSGETEPSTLPEQHAVEGNAEQLGSVLLIGDTAFDVPHMDKAAIARYAAAVTSIADKLGSGVKTFSMPVPNSAEFYTTSEYHTGATSQYDMIQLCKENLGSNVTFVDAYSVLAQHTSEYIYFRTDHHWTHLGAYYAYTALCKSAGFTPMSRDGFATGQWDNFVGSLYTYTASYAQSKVLKENPDTVYYWKPIADCKTTCYTSTALTGAYAMGTICKINEDVDNKYLTFMGGDHPVAIVETDTDGPCILVIKESYGNALISWLTSHYSKIILIDPREYFNKNSSIDLASFAQSQGVDQCLVVNYPMMLNSTGYISLLEKLAQ